jgi:hypothetical protein
MITIGFEARVLSNIVDEYVRSRKNRDWPISVASAVRAVRYISPSPGVSDTELASTIAAAAIAQGRNVDFDMVAEKSVGEPVRATA